MRLRWKSFERSTWRKVRAELRSSKPLWKEYRQRRRSRWSSINTPSWLIRVFVLVIFLGLRNNSPSLLIAAITLWTLASIFTLADNLFKTLYFSPNLDIYRYLPLSEQQVFAVQWNQFLRRSLSYIADFAAAYGMLALHPSNSISFALTAGVAFGLVQWAWVVATAVIAHTFRPARNYFLPSLLLGVATFAIMFFGSSATRLIGWINDLATWVPPVGWILYALGHTPVGSTIHPFVPCLLSAFMLALFPLVFGSLRRTYQLDEATLDHVHHTTANMDPVARQFPEAISAFVETSEESRAAIKSRDFLQPMNWQNLGWVERLVSTVLTAREKTVSEFMMAGRPIWTSLTKFLFFMIGGSLLVLWLIPPLKSIAHLLFFWVGATIFMGGMNWPGLGPINDGGGVRLPHYALLPVGFWDIVRVILKINVLMIFLWSPVVALLLYVITGSLRFQTSIADWAGPKIFVLLLLLQPVLVLLPIASLTKDKSLLNGCLLVPIVMLLLGGCGLVVFAETLRTAAIGAVLTGLFSTGILFVYGHFHNSSRFDLVAPPKKE